MTMEIIPGPNLPVPTSKFLTPSQVVANAPPALSFSVSKGGTSQTGIASALFTTVLWPTEVYDVGSYFASNAWTPPAGKIFLTSHVYLGGVIADTGINTCAIFKNSTLFKQSIVYASGTTAVGVSVSIEDHANGTDVYEVRAYVTTSSGDGIIDGTENNTYFMGHWLGS